MKLLIVVFFFLLQDNKQTTSKDHFQDVRLLSFERKSNVKWEAGDVAYIRPRNSVENVDCLFDIFKEHNLNDFYSHYVKLEGDDGELYLNSLRYSIIFSFIGLQCLNLK